MVPDPIVVSSIQLESSIPHSSRKNKKARRSARLRQSKLDARRDQWLSQVKSERPKEKLKENVNSTFMPMQNTQEVAQDNVEIRPAAEDNNRSLHQGSDLDSPSNSPGSYTSVLSRKTLSTNSSGCCSSSSGGSCADNMSEEEDRDGECLDDWEAVADALGIHENHLNPLSDIQTVNKQPPRPSQNKPAFEVEAPKQKCHGAVHRYSTAGQAWRSDDAFRPRSLPNLSRKNDFISIADRHKSVSKAPSSCPICYEDLDFTDSCFLPCLCGFQLCLFCHKRILEEDNRCPGCRKPYSCSPMEGESSVCGGGVMLHPARTGSFVRRY